MSSGSGIALSIILNISFFTGTLRNFPTNRPITRRNTRISLGKASSSRESLSGSLLLGNERATRSNRSTVVLNFASPTVNFSASSPPITRSYQSMNARGLLAASFGISIPRFPASKIACLLKSSASAATRPATSNCSVASSTESAGAMARKALSSALRLRIIACESINQSATFPFSSMSFRAPFHAAAGSGWT